MVIIPVGKAQVGCMFREVGLAGKVGAVLMVMKGPLVMHVLSLVLRTLKL